MSFPMTNIGGIEVSRLLCGTNPFAGFSHFSAARDNWLKAHFTAEKKLEVLEVCRQEGINCTLGGHDESYYHVLQEHERQTGHHWVWMCTPGGQTLEELKEEIRWCADHGAEICMPHQNFTDNRLLMSENRIVDGPEALQFIRDMGMIPGWSAHRPEVILVSDENDYDVETYITPYNATGFLCQVETDWTGKVIREAKKPVTIIKPLGAGRILPPTGLTFVYNTCKDVDTVAVGFMGPEEAKEDIDIARDLIEGRQSEHELQFTRSKSSFVKA